MRILLLCSLLLSAQICRAQTPTALNSGLFAAVQRSDVARVRSLLRRGADANARAANGNSVLSVALSPGDGWTARAEVVMRLLLRGGANPNANDAYGHTIWASAADDAERFHALLGAPAQIKPDKKIVLFVASGADYPDVMARLLRQGVSANVAFEGQTALMEAAGRGSAQGVALLLKYGAATNTRDGNGDTALIYAVNRNGESDALATRHLLDAGAPIEARNRQGETALLVAIDSGYRAALQTLLAAGANVNARDTKGETALMKTESSPWLTPLLLRHHPALDARDAAGETALMRATAILRYSDQSSALLLIEAGADVQARDARGRDVVTREGAEISLPVVQALLSSGRLSEAQTVALRKIRPQLQLFDAAFQQHSARAEAALQSGAQVNARDKEGQTPLMLAIHAWGNDAGQRARSIAMTRLLLRYGADANLETKDGSASTPLMKAANNAPILKLLLDAGANANRRNQYGETALTRLCQGHRITRASIDALLQGGANPNAGDGQKNTPLLLATTRELSGNADNMSFAQLADSLIAAGADINAANQAGQTALMSAAKAQRTDNVRVLLDRGASIEARDQQGRTALMHALEVRSYGRASSSGAVDQVWPAQSNVGLLLKRGADVNARDKTGASALVRVARINPRSLVRLGKIAPEYLAALNQEIAALARLLLAKGADVSLKTDNGNTAMKWAVARGNQPLIRLLENAGAK